MPGGDRTGPLGAGPRTGRGLGSCRTYQQPGFANRDDGFQGRLGFGRRSARRGRRHRFFTTAIRNWVPPTQEQETADLKAQADLLKTQLDVIQKRLKELDA